MRQKIEYFDVDGPIVACIGEHAIKGMFRLDPVSNAWELLDPFSEKFDTYHQTIYRNFRAECLDSDSVSRLPPLLAVVHQGQEDGLKEYVKSDYPNFFSLLKKEPQIHQIFVVLKEDTYETLHGDGYFRYFDSAYLNLEDARTAIDKVSQIEHMRGHLLNYDIRIDQGYDSLVLNFDKRVHDRISVSDVLKYIETRLLSS